MARRAAIIIEAVDRATPTFGKIRAGLTGLGAVAGAVGAVQIGQMLVRGLTASVHAAAEAQTATLALAHSIARSGQSVRAVLPGLEAQAKALQRQTGYSDDAIRAGQSLLITLGRLRGEGLERATEATLDLAAKMRIDLDQAFSVVAKAAAGNTTALERLVGTKLKGATAAERLAAGLSLIERTMGGAAAARLDSFQGQLDLAAENAGDLAKAIGGQLLPIGQAFLADFLNPLAADLTDSIEGTTSLRDVFVELGLALVPLLRSAEIWIRHADKLAEIAAAHLDRDYARLGRAVIDLARGFDTSSPAADRFERSLLGIKNSATDPAMNRAIENVEKLGTAVESVARKVAASSGIEEFVEVFDRWAGATSDLSSTVEELGRELEEAFAVKPPIEDVEILNELTRQTIDLALELAETGGTVGLRWHGTAETIRTALGEQLTASAFRFTDTLIDGAFGAEVSWSRFARQLLADLAKAIAHALVFSAIMRATGGGGIFGFLPAFGASGGTVRRFQTGGAVGPIGGNPNRGDVVPALLRPGEIVLTREQQRAIFQGSGGPIDVRVELGPNLRQIAEAVSVEVTRGGARLVASELRGPRWRKT
jgi:hypothetical protein